MVPSGTDAGSTTATIRPSRTRTTPARSPSAVTTRRLRRARSTGGPGLAWLMRMSWRDCNPPSQARCPSMRFSRRESGAGQGSRAPLDHDRALRVLAKTDLHDLSIEIARFPVRAPALGSAAAASRMAASPECATRGRARRYVADGMTSRMGGASARRRRRCSDGTRARAQEHVRSTAEEGARRGGRQRLASSCGAWRTRNAGRSERNRPGSAEDQQRADERAAVVPAQVRMQSVGAGRLVHGLILTRRDSTLSRQSPTL